MFAGTQTVSTKLIHRNQGQELIDAQLDEKPAHDLLNMSVVVPRSNATLIVESRSEKCNRKILAQQRKHERFIEQQKLAEQMEDLMEKVIHDTPLSRKEEDNLRRKIKTIVTKVNKESNTIDTKSHHISSRMQSDSNGLPSQSNLHSKPTNQRAFLLWNEKSHT